MPPSDADLPVDAARPPALVLRGGLSIDPPFVLAPMEGVTHRAFRDVVLDLGGVGAAWTEFLRVSRTPLKEKHIRAELGPPRPGVPVGVQLMGTEPATVAETARNAVAAGAPMIDLNFGCPAPVVFNKCAGSAMLDHPNRMRELIAAVTAAAAVPVTAKVRLGIRDAGRLRDVVQAVEDGGAAAITVHARTREDAYACPARWEHLAAARRWTRLPLIGNGDVLTPEDAHRMIDRTGVDGVMIGRGVLRDPWIFARLRARRLCLPAPRPDADDLTAFHVRYRDEMLKYGRVSGALSNLKQLYRRLDAAVEISPDARLRLLRSPTLATLESELETITRASAARRGTIPA